MAKTDGTTKKTSRATFWQEHLLAWSESGLTQADYCRQHELSRAAFGWWKRQLRGKPRVRKGRTGTKQAQQNRQPSVRFVEVQPGPDMNTIANAAVYEVLLSRGRTIRVGHEFDPDVLKRLITTVEASC